VLVLLVLVVGIVDVLLVEVVLLVDVDIVVVLVVVVPPPHVVQSLYENTTVDKVPPIADVVTVQQAFVS
jgi:hypothetical protein